MIRPTDLLAGVFALALLACGGAPVHSGYPAGETDPWASPTKMTLKDTGDASVEGAVNFAKRQRAKWYVVELPAPGVLNAKVKMDPRSTGADVGFEVLDAGYNIVVEAMNDNDIGEDEKIRNVKEARAGRYYFHVFALQRTDVADFKLRIRYDPAEPIAKVVVSRDPVDPKSTFPWTVPNLPAVPQVPPADDTPGNRRAKVVTEIEKPAVTESDPMDGATVTARITEMGGTPVRIVINKGSLAGVAEGWLGSVVDKNGKSLKKGTFKVKKVKNDECEGVVGLTLDEVQANPRVKLKAPQ